MKRFYQNSKVPQASDFEDLRITSCSVFRRKLKGVHGAD